MTALIGTYSLPGVVAFVHRYNRRTLVRSVLFVSLLSGVVILVFKQREVFDEMHQKRLFVIHMENVRVPQLSELLCCRLTSLRSRRTKVICSSEVRTLRLPMIVSRTSLPKGLPERVQPPLYLSLTGTTGTGMYCTPSPRCVYAPHLF